MKKLPIILCLMVPFIIPVVVGAGYPIFVKSNCVLLCERYPGIEIYIAKPLQKSLNLTACDVRITDWSLFVLARSNNQKFISAKFYENGQLLFESAPYSIGPEKEEIEIPAPFDRKCDRVFIY